MGRFWGSSQAPAYIVSVLLLGGLFHACSLNPQPAPPAKEGLADPSASAANGSASDTSSNTATSTTGTTGGAPVFDPSTSGTTGGAGVDANGDGVIDEADNESPQGGTAGAPPADGGGMLGGAAGAAGAPAEAPPAPANGPR